MNKISIIYDVTSHCPWNCSICCMGASSDKSCRNSELTLEQKLDVARQVRELRDNGYDVRADLSGGEIFTDIPAHKQVIAAFSEAIGKDKLGISCSGFGINEELANFLGQYVHDVEMTMDTAPGTPYKLRPSGYPLAAARAVPLLRAAGCKVGLQTVVSSYNSSFDDAFAVFAWSCANHVDNWSILRFFASGRGAAFPEAAMDDAACEKYVHMVQKLDEHCPSSRKPAIDFHYLMPGHSKYTDECRCVRKSIGILPDGRVVACFWALDTDCGTVEDKFLLGNVKDNSLLEILNSDKAHYWSDCAHCCELSA